MNIIKLTAISSLLMISYAAEAAAGQGTLFTLYEHDSYGGLSVSMVGETCDNNWDPTEYRMVMKWPEWWNDQASSFTVGNNCCCRAWSEADCTGTTTDWQCGAVSALSAFGLNDQVSCIECT
jgi:hypothetical protein